MTRPEGTGRELYMDIESDGLLTAQNGISAMTQVHCLGVIDMGDDSEHYFGPAVPEGHPCWTPLLGNPSGTIKDGMEFMSEGAMVMGHNSINFDFRACEKFYPKSFIRPAKAWDSYLLAKMIWPFDVLVGPDMARIRAKRMPPQLLKSHGLKAWGYRLGDNKDDYDGDRTKYPEPSDRLAKKGDERYDRRWEEWNPWMASYMMQDCRPGVKLWRLCKERLGWNPEKPADMVWPVEAVELEHEVAAIIAEQETFGIRFDVEAAQKLAVELMNQKDRINARLEETFGSWWQPSAVTTPAIDRAVSMPQFPDVTIPRYGKTGKELAPYVGPPKCRYSADGPYTPIERVTYQASSRDHLGMRLQAVFGWKPKKFGKNGKPTVDESVLEEIPEAVMPSEFRQLILDYFVVNKTLGMLRSGSRAWLSLVTEEGRIHGRCDTLGAVTFRATHSNPNLSQCPAINKEKITHEDGSVTEEVMLGLKGRYGKECRELFIADDGWELTGMDASALELIDLGHYLVPYDGGEFRDRVCDPSRDPHTEHSTLMGRTRSETKTATYLYIYGGSAYKLSLDTPIEDHEVPEALAYKGLPMLLKSLVRRFDQEFVDKLDDRQKARIAKARLIILAFENGIEGIKDLKKDVTQAAQQKGWLKGMDGRRLHVRKPHASLNTLLQSAGAITCKLWMALVHRKLRAQGLVHGVDFKQVLFVHDELGVTHRPGLHEVIKQAGYEAIKEAGEMLGLRGEHRADAKHGFNWSDTH